MTDQVIFNEYSFIICDDVDDGVITHDPTNAKALESLEVCKTLIANNATIAAKNVLNAADGVPVRILLAAYTYANFVSTKADSYLRRDGFIHCPEGVAEEAVKKAAENRETAYRLIPCKRSNSSVKAALIAKGAAVVITFALAAFIKSLYAV